MDFGDHARLFNGINRAKCVIIAARSSIRSSVMAPVILEVLGRGAHNLLEHFRKMVLVKKTQAIRDRLYRLVFVLKHLTGALHLHGCIQIEW